MKGMRSELSPFSLQKHNHVFLKLAVSCLLVGLTFRFLFSESFTFLSVVHTSSLANAIAQSPVIPSLSETLDSVDDFPGIQTQTSHNGNRN